MKSKKKISLGKENLTFVGLDLQCQIHVIIILALLFDVNENKMLN